MFTGELDQLSISAGKTVTFAVISSDKTVFTTSYVPTIGGIITLYGLGRIIDNFIDDLYIDIMLVVDGAPLGPSKIRVFRCAPRMTVRASTFLANYYLTPMQGPRVTALNRYESLSLYSAADEAATVEAHYYVAGEDKTKTFPLTTASGSRILNVSSIRFFDAAWGAPYMYDVKCGNRTARYTVLSDEPEISVAFIFRNGFGAWETFYLTGTRETDPQYTRSTANVNGFRRNYSIEEILHMKTYTGPLPDGMEAVAEDLARSKAVFYLMSNGDAGDEVIVTDCDLKHNNDGYAQSDLSFSYGSSAVSYRLADDRVARMTVPRPPQIFDDTFDESYE